MKPTQILIIVGPTATGKTDVAIELAKKLNGEVIACDSRQVYKGLDIGTGKMPSADAVVEKHSHYWIINSVKVWMYDVVSPREQYNVFQYIREVKKILEQITASSKLPIIVGGTGLYLASLLNGLSKVESDETLRKELETFSLEQLQENFKKLSLQDWENLNESERKNKRRLIRKIEVSSSPILQEEEGISSYHDVLLVGLTAEKNILNKRIDGRVSKRINQGMIEEAEHLHKNGLSLPRMRSLGLEYGILADYLEGIIKTREEFAHVLQTKIHQYAKRQITWFKKMSNIQWFDIENKNFYQKLEKIVLDWYNRDHEEYKN